MNMYHCASEYKWGKNSMPSVNRWTPLHFLCFLCVNNCDLWSSPYVCDGLFVFTVCGPYRYFISFGSDINDGSTNIVTVVIECFTHKTQELQGRRKQRGKRKKKKKKTNVDVIAHLLVLFQMHFVSHVSYPKCVRWVCCIQWNGCHSSSVLPPHFCWAYRL